MTEPNCIVLISIDDLRHDCLSTHEDHSWLANYDAVPSLDTPTLDSLGDAGVRFTRATSTASHTPPTHGSMFTGKYPKENGVRTFFTPLGADQKTITEVLNDQGFETYAWIENQALDLLDVTRGFDEVVCPFEDEDANVFEFLDRAMADGPVFVFLHLFDVHKPYCYSTGGTERERYNDTYLNEVENIVGDVCDIDSLLTDAETEAASVITDYESLTEPLKQYGKYRSFDYLVRERLEDEVGEGRFKYLVNWYAKGISKFDQGRFADIVDSIEGNLGSEYLWLTTADHGETRCKMYDREDLMNGPNVSEGAVRIPFVVRSDLTPFESLDKIESSINHVDIFPTIADLLEKENDDAISGQPLTQVIEKPDTARERYIFHETWYGPEGADFFGNFEIETGEGGLSEVAVRSNRYKLVHSRGITGNPEWALYDIKNDWQEEENLIDEVEAGELRAVLDRYLSDIDPEVEVSESDLSENDRSEINQRLKALGYLEE